MDLGTIRGFKTRFHLYTVPGQVYYNASRKLILKGVDGVVFVADCQIERMEANIEAMQNLYDNMAEHGYDLTKIPFVIQYNKRDLPNAAPIAELQAALNPGWAVEEPARQRPTPDPYHAGENLVGSRTGTGSSARRTSRRWPCTGDGVFDTLKAISKIVSRRWGRPTHVDPPERHHAGPDLLHAGHRAAAVHRGLLAQAHLLLHLPRRRRSATSTTAHLARSRNEVTDLGKLLDPLADKLLLLATLIPIYFISRWRHDLYDIPIWGSIPLWVCLLLIGRELAMTGFRWWAKQRGVVIPAGGAGKLKTTIQNIFIGAIILWFAFRDARKPMGWEHSALRRLLERVPRRLRGRDARGRHPAHGLLLRPLPLPEPAPSSRTARR